MPLLAVSFSVPAAEERCDDLAGEVVSVEGDVRVGGEPAGMGAEICSDERIEVGRLSRAAVRLEDTQTVVRIDQNSVFVIERSSTDRSLLDLLQGAIYLFSRQPESLRVGTPYVNAAIDGTEFVVDVGEGGSEVTVIEGRVLVENGAGELRLAAGEAALAASGGAHPPAALSSIRRTRCAGPCTTRRSGPPNAPATTIGKTSGGALGARRCRRRACIVARRRPRGRGDARHSRR